MSEPDQILIIVSCAKFCTPKFIISNRYEVGSFILQTFIDVVCNMYEIVDCVPIVYTTHGESYICAERCFTLCHPIHCYSYILLFRTIRKKEYYTTEARNTQYSTNLRCYLHV